MSRQQLLSTSTNNYSPLSLQVAKITNHTAIRLPLLLLHLLTSDEPNPITPDILLITPASQRCLAAAGSLFLSFCLGALSGFHLATRFFSAHRLTSQDHFFTQIALSGFRPVRAPYFCLGSWLLCAQRVFLPFSFFCFSFSSFFFFFENSPQKWSKSTQ